MDYKTDIGDIKVLRSRTWLNILVNYISYADYITCENKDYYYYYYYYGHGVVLHDQREDYQKPITFRFRSGSRKVSVSVREVSCKS